MKSNLCIPKERLVEYFPIVLENLSWASIDSIDPLEMYVTFCG
jgi:hypothetical protein